MKIADDVIEIASDGSYYMNGESDAELPVMVRDYILTRTEEEVCHEKYGCSYATLKWQ